MSFFNIKDPEERGEKFKMAVIVFPFIVIVVVVVVVVVVIVGSRGLGV